MKAVKTPLIPENVPKKSLISGKVVAAILTIIGVMVVMLAAPPSNERAELNVGQENGSQFPEESVGEFAVGLNEMKIGSPVGTQSLGS
jgi:hypothetical protein